MLIYTGINPCQISTPKSTFLNIIQACKFSMSQKCAMKLFQYALLFHYIFNSNNGPFKLKSFFPKVNEKLRGSAFLKCVIFFVYVKITYEEISMCEICIILIVTYGP